MEHAEAGFELHWQLQFSMSPILVGRSRGKKKLQNWVARSKNGVAVMKYLWSRAVVSGVLFCVEGVGVICCAGFVSTGVCWFKFAAFCAAVVGGLCF